MFISKFRDSTDAPMSPSSPAAPMPTTSSSLSPAEIANHLREILKPTKERRRIFDDNETLQRHSSNADIGPSVVGQLHAEKPIFTLKQMTTICEKICKVKHFYHFCTAGKFLVALCVVSL